MFYDAVLWVLVIFQAAYLFLFDKGDLTDSKGTVRDEYFAPSMFIAIVLYVPLFWWWISGVLNGSIFDGPEFSLSRFMATTIAIMAAPVTISTLIMGLAVNGGVDFDMGQIEGDSCIGALIVVVGFVASILGILAFLLEYVF